MLRLLLALLVWVSHTSRLQIGGPAVIVFFVLSGFWVTGLFVRHNGSIGSFILDRWLRIWPLMAIATIATVAVRQWLALPAAGNLASTLLLLGLATRHHDVLGVAWSLDFELQFYILLPLLMLLVAPAGVLVRWRALLLLLVATPVGLWLLCNHDIATVLVLVPAFGAGLAIRLTGWTCTGRSALASVVTFAGFGLVCFLVPGLSHIVLKTPGVWSDADLRVGMAWCLLLIPFIAWNVRQIAPPIDRLLGNLSYPFYLLHYPVLSIGMAAGWFAPGWAGKLVALLATVVVTLLTYRFIDRPIEDWRIARRTRLMPVPAQ
ncbi:acyltransferase [Polymorphobacter arshaanensis]|uniref:Acyltransferase n=1 Tax=Glacieibacterium arshaanense TaxID=2511025 RepID=A0A4Y9EQ78_9SPHN|nr:acyltransferase [Polymorphobacter arshaanensis]TFU05755.1 acyltransferase [Polymorphobacter arshaanensis]